MNHEDFDREEFLRRERDMWRTVRRADAVVIIGGIVVVLAIVSLVVAIIMSS